jgi:hypothetical protein
MRIVRLEKTLEHNIVKLTGHKNRQVRRRRRRSSRSWLGLKLFGNAYKASKQNHSNMDALFKWNLLQ